LPYDLALSEHNDLIFAANGDLQGVVGPEHVEQRIRLRIKMVRGSWVYDLNGDLGSNVHGSLGKMYERAATEIPMFVRQALETMEDVVIQDVQLSQPGEGIAEIMVAYQIVEPPGEVIEETQESEVNELAMQLPIEG
jgi:hypothetical protein